MSFPMMALVTKQGTAMGETALCSSCYASSFRDSPIATSLIGGRTHQEFARSLAWGDSIDPKASDEFQDCGDNEALTCVVCGFPNNVEAIDIDGGWD